jgi:urate oxidase
MKLVSQNYGKQRIRVLKVMRGSPRHEVKELEVGVRLEGDFASSYAAADNSKVVPTDTMKNTVQVLAHQHLGMQTEPFALLLARHFLENYAQVSRVIIETVESRWSRMAPAGQPHDHAFVGASARPVTRVAAARGAAPENESGNEDHEVHRLGLCRLSEGCLHHPARNRRPHPGDHVARRLALELAAGRGL